MNTQTTYQPLGVGKSSRAAATVFIVDDDPAMRKSLAWLVESVDLRAETYETATAFLDRFDPERPGCLLCDVRMPGMSGLELQERLRAIGSQIPVIMITGYGDIACAVRAMKAGAVDFLEKPVSDQTLLDHIQRAIERDSAIRAARGELLKIRQRFGLLTRREQEVMSLVVEGHSSKEIAGVLGVSFKTVEAHRAKIMRKTEARSVPHLIRMSLMRGAGEPGEPPMPPR
ncbi:MAG TPA: response regulator transcription factor [Planctomycetaceae bacterium]